MLNSVEARRSDMPPYTSIVTMLVALLLLHCDARAARAPQVRRATPGNHGHPDFERSSRSPEHAEWMPIFLPSLWLCAYYLSDVGAAVLGLVPIVGRSFHYVGYTRSPRRLPGFFIQSSVCLLLVIGAIVGMAMRFFGA
jgi:uncharacterized membrane protein YecN with MAPEG domain